MSEQERVVLSLVERDGKILLIHRKTSENGLAWSLPGGKVEKLENDKAASRREVQEEVGVNCRPTRKLGERRHPDTGRHIVYWVCEYLDGVPASREPDKIDRVAWVYPEEFLRTVTTNVSPAVRRYLDKLQGTASRL